MFSRYKVRKKYAKEKVNEGILVELQRDYWREEKSEQRYLEKCCYEFDESRDTEIHETPVLDQIISEYESSLINEVIKSLTIEERLLVFLVYELDLSLRSVARILEISPSSVCKRHNKLLEKMRLNLKD